MEPQPEIIGLEFDQSRNITRPEIDPSNRWILTLSISIFTGLSIAGSFFVLGYILQKRMYRNYVSSHFIGHLMVANLVGCAYLLPVFIQNIRTGEDMFGLEDILCRIHVFILCAQWTVVHFMIACIAGVHLLTFARIHYDQLFGLSPKMICSLSWLVGAALGLPCLTNTSITEYDFYFHYCLFGETQTTYKFLAYLVLLGVLLPIGLTFYAYMRVLAIFYHSPVVFEALGIFRSRYLIFTILLHCMIQFPFYVYYLIPDWHIEDRVLTPLILLFLAHSLSLNSCWIYGASLILMKEDDIALTHRTHKAATYIPPGVDAPQV